MDNIDWYPAEVQGEFVLKKMRAAGIMCIKFKPHEAGHEASIVCTAASREVAERVVMKLNEALLSVFL